MINKTVQQIVTETLSHQEPPHHVEVLWVSPEEMRSLNKEYRMIDTPTDVLSFPLYSYKELQKHKGEEPLLLGSLVLCKSEITARAKEEGIGFEERLVWTVEHGLKHLKGYDHNTDGTTWKPIR